MRTRDSRLANKLMFGAWVTTNMSQRIGRPLVHLPVPVTFNMSQLAAPMLRDEDYVIFAFLLRLVQTFIDVRFLSVLCLTLSRAQPGFSSDSGSCQNLGVSPAEPGVPAYLNVCRKRNYRPRVFR